MEEHELSVDIIARLYSFFDTPIDSAKEKPVAYYGGTTSEQQESADEFLKPYIRDDARYVNLGDVTDFLSETFGIEIPELKTYRVRKTALQPVFSDSKVRAFDEDEANELAQDEGDDDWTVDPDGEMQDVSIEIQED